MSYFFYRDCLDEYEQSAYDAIYESLHNMSEQIFFPTLPDMESVTRIWHYVLYDDPTLFYVSAAFEAGGRDDGFSTAWPTYIMDAATAAAYAQVIDRVANDLLNWMYQFPDEHSMVVAAYEAIIQMCEYGFNADDQNMGSVFVEGISCCAGYSRAFQYLLSLADIPCVYIVGESYGVASDGPHAWNLAYIEGDWCWFDLTWGDPVSYNGDKDERSVSYDYCGVSDEYMDATHYPDPEILHCLPSCQNDYNDWYVRHNLLLDQYDKQLVLDVVYGDTIDRGTGLNEPDGFGESAVKFSNDRAFDDACESLIYGADGAQVLFSTFREHGRSVENVKFTSNPGTRSVHMTYHTYAN